MPITQDRMMELVEAAKDYKRAWEELTKGISTHGAMAVKHKETAQTLLEVLVEFIPAAAPAPTSTATIIIEDKWFKRFANSNRLRANRAKVRKALDSIGPSTSGKPEDFIELSTEDCTTAYVAEKDQAELQRFRQAMAKASPAAQDTTTVPTPAKYDLGDWLAEGTTKVQPEQTAEDFQF